MSGGHYDYEDSRLFDKLYPYSWSREKGRSFADNPYEDHEISDLMYDLLSLTHDLDWYKSGDICEQTYIEQKEKFKDKWFGKGMRRKNLESLINRMFKETKAECMKMIGVTSDGKDD